MPNIIYVKKFSRVLGNVYLIWTRFSGTYIFCIAAAVSMEISLLLWCLTRDLFGSRCFCPIHVYMCHQIRIFTRFFLSVNERKLTVLLIFLRLFLFVILPFYSTFLLTLLTFDRVYAGTHVSADFEMKSIV